MVKNSNFFELFGPLCGNPLANLDGSMAECAQVCALDTRPHLTTLRKTETVGGSVALGVIRKTGITSQGYVGPTLLNFYPFCIMFISSYFYCHCKTQ